MGNSIGNSSVRLDTDGPVVYGLFCLGLAGDALQGFFTYVVFVGFPSRSEVVEWIRWRCRCTRSLAEDDPSNSLLAVN
eukprot:NODE_10272_length_341_cov_26.750000_g9361_i0.p2 GENE.NODE_10272_length_341_cov_26.750000_g9361_i0~~NODE_10272_length_341_cov_26.750000_g9361_i0.p2  ORF type:complete len:85 (-),score=15.23 NODE_10272_length_341_cov_26.750000_g9361_i0:87-320(-)